eukprot:12689_4
MLYATLSLYATNTSMLCANNYALCYLNLYALCYLNHYALCYLITHHQTNILSRFLSRFLSQLRHNIAPGKIQPFPDIDRAANRQSLCPALSPHHWRVSSVAYSAYIPPRPQDPVSGNAFLRPPRPYS